MPGSRKRNPETGLTEQQQRFADEYLVDFDATSAYHRAGYKGKGEAARVSACQLMAKVEVAEYIRKQATKVSQGLEISAEKTLRELGRVAFFDPGKMYNDDGTVKTVKEMDEDTRAAIAGVEVTEIRAGEGIAEIKVGQTKKLRLASKVEALGKLALHFGLLVKKVESNVRISSIQGILEDIDGSDTGPGPASSRRAKGKTG